MNSDRKSTPRKTGERMKNKDVPSGIKPISSYFSPVKDQNRCQEDELILGESSQSGRKKRRLTISSDSETERSEMSKGKKGPVKSKSSKINDATTSEPDTENKMENPREKGSRKGKTQKKKVVGKPKRTASEGSVNGTRPNNNDATTSEPDTENKMENPREKGSRKRKTPKKKVVGKTKRTASEGSVNGTRPNITERLQDLKNSGENGSGDITKQGKTVEYQAHRIKLSTAIPFDVSTTYETPIGESLMKEYKSINTKTSKTRTNGLQINLESGELVNPNSPSGWFDKCQVVFDLRSYPHIDYRDYSVDLDKNWYAVKIDQTKGKRGSKFSYSGIIKVYGCEGETLRDALRQDGRFLETIFENKKVIDSNGTQQKFSKNMETLSGKTLKLFHGKNLEENDGKGIDCGTSDNKNPGLSLQNGSLTDKSTNETTGIDHAPPNQSAQAKEMSPILKINQIEGSWSNIFFQLNEITGINWNLVFGEKTEGSKAKTKNNKAKVSSFIGGYSLYLNYSSSIDLYQLLVERSNHVCKLQYPIPNTLKTGLATGFFIGILPVFDQRDHIILMTCYHVVDKFHSSMANPDFAKKCFANFGYHNRNPANPKVRKTKNYLIKPGSLLVSNDLYDYALIALEFSKDLLTLFKNMHGLGKWVCDSDTMPGNKEILRLIGHPGGEPKQLDQLVVISDAKSEINLGLQISNSAHGSLEVDDKYYPGRMYYQCNSFQGASGSPCFDSNGNVACLHSDGIPVDGVDLHKGSKLEIGVSLYYIVKDILLKVEQKQVNGLTTDMVYKLFPQFQPPEPMEVSDTENL